MKREAPKREFGVIKMWRGGWGFIYRGDDKDDVYCHISDVETGQQLLPNMWVSFYVMTGQRGRPRACGVMVERQ